jgi:hypothetical protein
MIRALVAFALPLLPAALAGCDTVDLGATPADVNACRPSEQFFVQQVWPNYLSKDFGGKHCYDPRCHDGSGTGGALNLNPPAVPLAFPLPPEWQNVYKSASEQTECTIPRSSKIVEKPDGVITHGGGMLISPSGPEVDLIVQWVSAP